MGLFSWLNRLKARFSGQSQERWVSLDGGTSSGGISDQDLLGLYTDTAYACAGLNARGVSKAKLRLYVKTRKNQPAPKCVTAPIGRKANEWVREALGKASRV